jgi:hypothetical protein
MPRARQTPQPAGGMPSLYRRVLGDALEELPPALRHFHARETGGEATGALHVTVGQGWLWIVAAAMLRLPAPADRLPMRLQVVVQGERERWVREIGGRQMITVQEARDGLLIESFGSLRVAFRLVAKGETLRFESDRCWLGPAPLPAWLAPRIEAISEGRPDGWWVRVRVEAPCIGLLLAYEGEVTPS